MVSLKPIHWHRLGLVDWLSPSWPSRPQMCSGKSRQSRSSSCPSKNAGWSTDPGFAGAFFCWCNREASNSPWRNREYGPIWHCLGWFQPKYGEFLMFLLAVRWYYPILSPRMAVLISRMSILHSIRMIKKTLRIGTGALYSAHGAACGGGNWGSWAKLG